MRVFIGIPLPEVIAAEISRVTARLRTPNDGLRWTTPESWHITLQFLGNATQQQYDCLIARLDEVRSLSVPIRLGGLDLFERTGVLFTGVAALPELVLLAQRVNAATAHCGFVPESRPFRPHITLARAKERGPGGSLRAIAEGIQRQPAFSQFAAAEFLLYESHLGPSGSRYEVRARFSLANQAD
jgi:RNA 2',3'-cyclic 3'-phosphodiesterase